MVGLGREKRLALGAATGTPAVSISARATRCAGTRTATLGRPAVTMSGTAGFFGRISVRGPAQQASASARAAERHARGHQSQLPDVREVHDEGIGGGPLFRGEDLRHRHRIECVGAQAVHRLGGKRHERTGAQRGSRLLDGGRVGALGVNRQHARGDGHGSSIRALVPSTSAITRL